MYIWTYARASNSVAKKLLTNDKTEEISVALCENKNTLFFPLNCLIRLMFFQSTREHFSQISLGSRSSVMKTVNALHVLVHSKLPGDTSCT